MAGENSEVNHCQQCQLCCKLLGVVEIEKMPGTWCRFCKIGSGCTIHDRENYPTDCGTYVCLWLQSQQDGHPLPPELRPDRCNVIIDARLGENAHNVRCNTGFPHAWKQQKVQNVLGALVRAGSTLYVVTPQGDQKKLHLLVADNGAARSR